MSYSTDLTDEQWALLEPVFNTRAKRGPKLGRSRRLAAQLGARA